jgi:hypothetical protein
LAIGKEAGFELIVNNKTRMTIKIAAPPTKSSGVLLAVRAG